MNPVKELQAYGQSVWLDYIRRTLVTSGELERLVQEDGLSGLTSNPTLFEKAIAGSTDYDAQMTALLRDERCAEPKALYEALAIEDIRRAADVLRPVFDATGGADGFVSLEVSPHLAHDTAGTVAEVRRLREATSRPNVMVKVPATPEGIPAIETLTADGINVNITLIFSLRQYEQVAQAYLRGLARCDDPASVASVASFFVSRVDTAVDRALDALNTPDARSLLGRVAIANAKVAYRRFREIFGSDAFGALRARGARLQRPLWGSTGTKNPLYSDVLYVEELIGPDTVNTMPPATLDAFRDHGRPRASLEQGLDEASRVLDRLAALGIDLAAITERLQTEGVEAFAKSFDALLQSLEAKRRTLVADRVNRQAIAAGRWEAQASGRLEQWTRDRFARRMWSRDHTLWSRTPVPELTDRLGWLTLFEPMREQLDDVTRFVDEVTAEGTRHVVLLGMGGSSLAPEVFQATFGPAPGHPELLVLDSTHPAAVAGIARTIDPARTLFIVSSKSGTTLESLSFFRAFWALARKSGPDAGRRFVAITDPGTPLEALARARGFRRVFRAQPDVGGRYSALTVFGLVPAALVGVDVHALLDRAWTLAEASSFCVPEASNPGLVLGAALGELTLAGRDKVTFATSPSLARFPTWLEQLIAESTGKGGKGIVPVADEPIGAPSVYGDDRVFVSLVVDGEEDRSAGLAELDSQGHPAIRIHLHDRLDLGQELFRWELATAAAGAVLGINPFDQPDVQLAKDLARKAMQDAAGGRARDAENALRLDDRAKTAAAVRDWVSSLRPGDYFAVQAYLPPTPGITGALQALRVALRDATRLATTAGFGPRFLHSTGQLHKGGPNTGIFLQILDVPHEDVQVPETDYSFAAVIRAQAEGDYRALVQRQRRVLRVQLGEAAEAGLTRLVALVREAL